MINRSINIRGYSVGLDEMELVLRICGIIAILAGYPSKENRLKVMGTGSPQPLFPFFGANSYLKQVY